MKQAETAAVVAFKADIDRMADYLRAAGYDIQRTHLMEAGARFKGARDWRTLRAELAQDTGKGTKEMPPAPGVPQIGNKTLTVYFESWGDGPSYCWVNIDQKWLDIFFELRAQLKSGGLESVESAKIQATWLDVASEYRPSLERIVVEDVYFHFTAYPKHGDEDMHTSYISIDTFLPEVLATLQLGRTVLFYGGEDRPQYEDTPRDCYYHHARLIALDEVFLSRNDELSFEEVLEAVRIGDPMFIPHAAYRHLAGTDLGDKLVELANAKEAELLTRAGMAVLNT